MANAITLAGMHRLASWVRSHGNTCEVRDDGSLAIHVPYTAGKEIDGVWTITDHGVDIEIARTVSEARAILGY